MRAHGGRKFALEARSHSHSRSTGRFLAANLLGGVLQCLVSCLLGLVPPTAVGWYAMMLKTHVAFMMNGFLAMLVSFFGPEIGKSLSDDQMKVWALTMQLGTWFNGLAHLKGAISGTKAPMVRSMGRAPYGEDAVMEGMLMFCGVNIIVALVLTCWGLHKRCKA